MQLLRTCDFLGLLDIRVKHIIDWQASLVKESSLTRRKRRIQLSLRERFQADRVDDNDIAVCVYPLTADITGCRLFRRQLSKKRLSHKIYLYKFLLRKKKIHKIELFSLNSNRDRINGNRDDQHKIGIISCKLMKRLDCCCLRIKKSRFRSERNKFTDSWFHQFAVLILAGRLKFYNRVMNFALPRWKACRPKMKVSWPSDRVVNQLKSRDYLRSLTL